MRRSTLWRDYQSSGEVPLLKSPDLSRPRCLGTGGEGVVDAFLEGREQMAVGAEGDVDRGVAEAFHHRSGMGTLGDEERRVGCLKS